MIEQLTPWEHQVAPGLAIRGLHTAPQSRPLVHFLHGNGFCGLVYKPLLEQLGRDFDLFLSDAQGHGQSDVGDRFVGWNRCADYAIEALEAHRQRWPDQPIYGVGHSFGGVLTLLMAAKRPDLFDRVVLLDPVLFTRSMIGVMALSDVVGLYSRNSMATRARQRQSRWESRQAAWDYFHERGIFKGWHEQSLAAYIDHALKPEPDGSLSLRCPPTREAEIFSSFPRGLWTAVSKLSVPATIIHGTKTYPFVPKAAQAARRKNPLIDCLTMPGGHCFMQENPDATVQLVRHLLSSRSASAA